MNTEFVKNLSKTILNTPINQELTPGSVDRRYEPASGIKKHRERIHNESKSADNKNLPFTFRKPIKPRSRATYLRCNNCGHIVSASLNTVGIICNNCKKYSSVTEVES